MGQFDQTLLSSDLDHIIGQRSTSITGVLPASITDVVFDATCTQMDESREVEVNGVYQDADSEFTINSTKYDNLPSIGSIFTDSAGRQIKVLSIETDDADNPIQMTLICNRRYTSQ
jgi:hypothetical protein